MKPAHFQVRQTRLAVTRILLLSAIFTFGLFTFAKAQYFEQVYLKNGSIIRGIVTEQVPGVHIKIQMADGSIFAYPYDQVEKITKDFLKKEPKDSKTPRYEGGVSVLLSAGLNGHGGNLGLLTTHGCLIIPYLYVGAGIAVIASDSTDTSNPIFADARGYFMKGNLKPYANLRIGYDFLLSGIYLSPAVGLRYKLLDFSFGYSLQGTWDIDEYYYDYRDYIHSLTFNLGLRF